MDNDKIENIVFISLYKELGDCDYLIYKGFADLEMINDIYNYYFAPLLLISTGFDRLLKCVIAMALTDDQGRIGVRDAKKIERKMHDLRSLRDMLINILNDDKFSETRKTYEGDLLFIRKDPYLRDVLGILSDFGKGARYYYLNNILYGYDEKNRKNYPNPEYELKKLMSRIADERKIPLDYGVDFPFRRVNCEIIKLFERFYRSIIRFLDAGEIHPQSNNCLKYMSEYLVRWEDEYLGRGAYFDKIYDDYL